MRLKRALSLAILSACMAAPAWAEDPVGKWSGVVKAPGADIPIILTVSKGEDGKLSAGMESPSQAPGMIIPVDSVSGDGDTLGFAIAQILGSYEGSWDAAKGAWVGTWTQNDVPMPLELKRAG